MSSYGLVFPISPYPLIPENFSAAKHSLPLTQLGISPCLGFRLAIEDLDCAWREFKLVLNQVSRAIEPLMPLAQIIGEWNDISSALAEPPRRRLPQLSEYFK